MSDISLLKQDMRREMLKVRNGQIDAQKKSEQLIGSYFSAAAFDQAQIIAAFWPIAGEIDVRPLLESLSNAGKQIVLPKVVKKDTPLIFKSWKPGDELEEGPHKTFHPFETAETMDPDTILVPLLACDEQGGRLGFGGGYYDRTLAEREVMKIGVAYDDQLVKDVPMDEYDQRLDWIVTPTQVIECQK